jgi:cytidylate kinase
MIITIDGPAGSGKSSAAKALARRLGFEFLDTGAMYRAVTLAGLRAGIDLRAEHALAGLLANLTLEMPPGRVVLNGEDVTGQIRTALVTAASAPVADSPAVRRRLRELQRIIAAGRDIICEGRDQGTVVFPDAACKFFLVADPLERARRRQREMAARGEVRDLQDVLADQEARDRRDAARDLAPMVPAADAIRLDSTDLTLDQLVDRLEREVQRCRSGPPTSATSPGTGSGTPPSGGSP